MGGDALKDVQILRIKDQDFWELVHQIRNKVKEQFQKIQVYIPLPQKTDHGDIDFIVLAQNKYDPKKIPTLLHSKSYKISGNILSFQYSKHQIDFNFYYDQDKYSMAYYYNAYGGIGNLLGVIANKNQLKLSSKGLFFIKYPAPNLKVQVLLTKNTQQYYKFFGLDFKRFLQGFQNREQLFNYVLGCNLFDIKYFESKQKKKPTKILKSFIQYCTKLQKQKYSKKVSEQVGINALKYFNKQQQLEFKLIKLQQANVERDIIKQKFNGIKMMKEFGISEKQIKNLKNSFYNNFQNKQAAKKFILNECQQEIYKILKGFIK